MRITTDGGCEECQNHQFVEKQIDGVTVFKTVGVRCVEFRIDTQEDYEHCDYGTPCNICKDCLAKALKLLETGKPIDGT